MRSSPRKQSGFTVVELIIVTCIIGILASVAINSTRDYQRRARMSEVVLATGTCKTMLSESFPILDTPPDPGGWGCEQSGGNTTYAGAVQTSPEGVIRVAVRNIDAAVNNRYVYLVPARGDGATAMTADTDLGNSVRAWICGSDWQPVLNALPANCRIDMTTYANKEFGP